jgi:PKD repeat protein
MTWGRKYGDASNCAVYPPVCTFEGMQARLRQSYVEMADDNQALVTPVGQAFKYARIADSTINLYVSDNSHPSPAGTYLAACTFYATIFETSPIGITYTGGLTNNQAAFLQQIAYQTVFDSLSIWNVNEFEPQANFTYNPFGNFTNQFQYTSTSTNAISYYWLFDNFAYSTNTNPIYTFTTPGIHTVSLVVSNGCTFDTIIQEINISPAALQGLNTVNTPQIIQISNQIEISNLQIASATNDVVVYNAIGEQVFNKTELANQSLFISTFSWKKGVYLVQILNGNKTYTQKIILQ